VGGRDAVVPAGAHKQIDGRFDVHQVRNVPHGVVVRLAVVGWNLRQGGGELLTGRDETIVGMWWGWGWCRNVDSGW